MDVKKQVEEMSKMQAKLSMPLWKWAAIGGGIVLAVILLLFLAWK